MVLKNQRGQTVVEYILLLVVALSLVMTFYRSDAYKRLFGSQGQVGLKLKEEGEWGYRHAYLEGKDVGAQPPQYSGASAHPSYRDSSNDSRFFGPLDPYF